MIAHAGRPAHRRARLRDGGDRTDRERRLVGARTTSRGAGVIVFNGRATTSTPTTAQPPFENQTVIHEPPRTTRTGLDINAQICFFPDGPTQRFIAGEDTGQPDPPRAGASSS